MPFPPRFSEDTKVTSPAYRLRRFSSIPSSDVKVIAHVGDSTISNPFVIVYSGSDHYIDAGINTNSYFDTYFGKSPSAPFYNCQHYNFALNGQTLANFVAGTTTGATVQDIAATNPHLIRFSYGINDVRLGTKTKDELKDLLTKAINTLLLACPRACIILQMPNSLAYDSGNANSYIDAPVSLTKVQEHSDRLRLAYREISLPDNVVLWDTQSGPYQVFQEVVETTGSDPLHGDALHPSNNAYLMLFKTFAAFVTQNTDLIPSSTAFTTKEYTKPLNRLQCDRANSKFSTNDFKYYPRIVEDQRYFNTIILGSFVGTVGTNIVIASNGSILPKDLVGACASGDIVCQYNTTTTTDGTNGERVVENCMAYAINANKNESGNNIQFFGLTSGLPKTQYAGEKVIVARRRPTSQKAPQEMNPCYVFSEDDFTSKTVTTTIQRFSVISTISYESTTAPSTGGTIDLKLNGTTFATITVANNATTGTISGTFVGSNTKGISINEGARFTYVINSGFVGGTFPRITLSK